VNAVATAFVNWPDIENTPASRDWSAADNELEQLADPLGLSLSRQQSALRGYGL
jgi:hypothetical protein